MLFEEIQSKIWGLSASAGTSPFTFLHFAIDEKLKSAVPADCLNGYTQGIAFFLWEDYAIDNYRDYLTLSKQYLMTEDECQRANFIITQASKMAGDKDYFLQWQHNQIFIALGVAISEIRTSGIAFKDVGPNGIDCFKESVEIKGGLLKDIVLF